MGVILKFGGTLFVHLVFYDFFRDQLKTRVRDRKLRFLILLLFLDCRSWRRRSC